MDDHGEMHGDPMQGFYSAESQMLSHYEMKINGKPIRHRLTVQLSSNEWASNGSMLGSGDEGNLPEGTLPAGSVEVRILRRIDQGMTERVIIKNNGCIKNKIRFELSLVCPMRDSQFEDEMKREGSLPRRGLVARPFPAQDYLGLRFKKSFGPRKNSPTEEFRRLYGKHTPKNGELISRELEIKVRPLSGSPRSKIKIRCGKVNVIQVDSVLESRRELVLEFLYEPIANGHRLRAPGLTHLEPLPLERSDIPPEGVQIETSNSTLNLILGQAITDLRSLVLPVFGETEDPEAQKLDAFIAGVPRYLGLFGRDNLITSWQSALIADDMCDSVLSRLAALRGTRKVDWRDEEVDRLPHEQRVDPYAEIGVTNREIYYGDVTSTPFWILALASHYRWHGAMNDLKKHEDTLRSCLRWIRTRLKQGHGFIYYAPALPGHPDENRNQAWKDSGDAIVDADGRIRVPPLALVEIQAYAYQALNEGARILELLGDSDTDELFKEASALKERFNRVFWVPELNFYALALDRHRKPLKSKASNVGHALTTGILDDGRVDAVVKGLISEDMFSGWGIRTLSKLNPAYDPFSYHRGSVWPVENAFIADGFAVHGYHDESNSVSTAQFSLAAMFEHLRLPEVISGHDRETNSPVPALYTYTNLLQAWSVSAIAQHLQIMLGVRPRADQGVLYLNPHLPEWLSWVELKNVTFRGCKLHLRFWRSSDGRSHWNVLHNPGRVVVRDGASFAWKLFEDSLDRQAG